MCRHNATQNGLEKKEDQIQRQRHHAAGFELVEYTHNNSPNRNFGVISLSQIDAKLLNMNRSSNLIEAVLVTRAILFWAARLPAASVIMPVVAFCALQVVFSDPVSCWEAFLEVARSSPPASDALQMNCDRSLRAASGMSPRGLNPQAAMLIFNR